jgi:site-specific DNA recombinase
MKKPIVRKRRCAIYTRKSSEEGLEQEFNSLDAQREACEAYIASQKPEGWVLVPNHYDDGGISGATLDRPASSGCSPTSRRTASTSWWSTRSTGLAAR